MQRPSRPQPPRGFLRAAFRLPVLLYRARLGGLLGNRFVLIQHTGRRTGRPRETVVEVVDTDPGTGALTVASAYGPRADWYRNLLAQPTASVQQRRSTWTVRTEVLTPDEAGAALATYARQHPRAARRILRFLGHPEVIAAEGYREVGARLPMLRLVPESG